MYIYIYIYIYIYTPPSTVRNPKTLQEKTASLTP